jgi:hypothetical protein
MWRMPVNDPAEQIEADADELEERIGKLDDHLGEARKKASARKPNGDPDDDDDAGDDDTGGFDDPEADEEEEDE